MTLTESTIDPSPDRLLGEYPDGNRTALRRILHSELVRRLDHDRSTVARTHRRNRVLDEFPFSHTFETTGTYTYFCEPPLSLGMKGAIVVE